MIDHFVSTMSAPLGVTQDKGLSSMDVEVSGGWTSDTATYDQDTPLPATVLVEQASKMQLGMDSTEPEVMDSDITHLANKVKSMVSIQTEPVDPKIAGTIPVSQGETVSGVLGSPDMQTEVLPAVKPQEVESR